MGLTAVLLAVCVLNPAPGLEGFVGRDLTKLSNKDQIQFDRLCSKLLPQVKSKRDPFSLLPTPTWIKPYRIGGIAWLYLRVYPGYDVPDVSYVEAFAFDDKWQLKDSYYFPTGYRLFVRDVKLSNEKWLPQPVLTIKVVSAGPFIVVDGKPAKPLFHPDSGILQRYTFDEGSAHLIGITSGKTEMLSNSYQWKLPMIGPTSVGRSNESWRADLQSADPSRQLASMVWLAGDHLSSSKKRERSVSQESIADSKTYETLRSNAQIRTQVEALSNSPNPWLRKQATYTLKFLK